MLAMSTAVVLAFFSIAIRINLLAGLEVLPITDTCLHCICQAASDCDMTRFCGKGVCGTFRITKPYWIDAGEPQIGRHDKDSDRAYRECTNNYNCAKKTLRRYMARYLQDCNKDGVIDCGDYAGIHWGGPTECNSKGAKSFSIEINQCLRKSPSATFTPPVERQTPHTKTDSTTKIPHLKIIEIDLK